MIHTIDRGASTASQQNIRYRLGKVKDLLPIRGRWLDCGCADGGYTAALRTSGAQHTIGIDVERDRVIQAQAQHGSSTITFAHALSETLPFQSASFDGAFVNEVLEHVANEQQTLGELFRVLRPGGVLVLISPNRWFPFETHGMQLGKLRINRPVPLLPWLPYVLARHMLRARNYWSWELLAQVQASGFVVQRQAYVFPVFDTYRWLPAQSITWYRAALPLIEQTPIIRAFGVSTFILAHRPSEAE